MGLWVMEYGGQTVPGAMGKAEVRRVDMVPEQCVAEFVQHDPNIGGDSHVLSWLRPAENEGSHAVPHDVPTSLGVDLPVERVRVDRNREVGVVEVFVDRKTHALDPPEHRITMIVSAAGREIVRRTRVIKIEGRPLRS